MAATQPSEILNRADYQLEVEDNFDGAELDTSIWVPYYLPQWSSRSAAAARYELADGTLRLLIDADQGPWCPEYDGWLRVSSLQTGVFAGPAGSGVGQHRFAEGMVVREAQENAALYTPLYGLFELRAKALDDPASLVALWTIGYEDLPERSGEILIMEIFGRDVRSGSAAVGMGVRPHHDPALVNEFAQVTVAIDVREFHTYSAEWTPDYVAHYIDERLVKVVRQSIAYPMQFMLGIYELADGPELSSAQGGYPKVFVVDWFRGYRRATTG
jgi:Glycosyl hydrolases family 16